MVGLPLYMTTALSSSALHSSNSSAQLRRIKSFSVAVPRCLSVPQRHHRERFCGGWPQVKRWRRQREGNQRPAGWGAGDRRDGERTPAGREATSAGGSAGVQCEDG